MNKAKIIGASGYGGIGIIELLLKHPEVEIQSLVAKESVGKPISELYPHLAGYCDMPITEDSDPRAQEPADIVFLATPDGVGMNLAPAEIEKGAKVIDYSGDFRFNTEKAYAEYAARIGKDTQHASPELLNESVYGLTELHRPEITPDKSILGNPGCMAIGCILGLAPALKEDIIKTSGIICDAKTGISGAGKKPSPVFHYPASYENMSAYKLAGHQHVCEIERELGSLAGEDIKVTFTSQVVPASRGIMATLYGKLKSETEEAAVIDLYKSFYKDSPFVKVFESSSGMGTIHVRGTNRCFIVVSIDTRTQTLRIVSYIDNLVKGQAGSALQNMNLLLGLPETMGMDKPGMYP